jgi:hypothetical protein
VTSLLALNEVVDGTHDKLGRCEASVGSEKFDRLSQYKQRSYQVSWTLVAAARAKLVCNSLDGYTPQVAFELAR